MENWKDIKGYEGFYQVSDTGRVKSLSRVVKHRNIYMIVKEKILKQCEGNSGYLKVNLYKESKGKTFFIHILVAMAFLNHTPNGHTLVVDHKNNDKIDNILSNLQIITNRHNSSKDRKGGLSKYTGVSYSNKNRNWVSMIYIDAKHTYLGTFDTEHRASIAYNFALTQLDKLKEYNLTR
jgi:hypothetical protein